MNAMIRVLLGGLTLAAVAGCARDVAGSVDNQVTYLKATVTLFDHAGKPVLASITDFGRVTSADTSGLVSGEGGFSGHANGSLGAGQIDGVQVEYHGFEHGAFHLAIKRTLTGDVPALRFTLSEGVEIREGETVVRGYGSQLQVRIEARRQPPAPAASGVHRT